MVTYGLNGLCKGDEHPAYTLLWSMAVLYLSFYQISALLNVLCRRRPPVKIYIP